jgi:hypothetical protein
MMRWMKWRVSAKSGMSLEREIRRRRVITLSSKYHISAYSQYQKSKNEKGGRREI